ncbi:MAG TPA: DUF882 domain-containing protein [Polyangiales bacterium]|nr:DUF882 domain-containing protein [Polyangiales bacterium]
MESRRTTIMILAPGRDAISLDVAVWRRRLLPILCMPLMLGVAAQRTLGATRGASALAMGSLQQVVQPSTVPTAGEHRSSQPAQLAAAGLRTLMTAVRPVEGPRKGASVVTTASAANTISVKAILKAISDRRRAVSEVEPDAVPINGVLRIQALHLGEMLSTRPFDDLLRPDPRAFADIKHLMRCRVTGHEIDMDPRLIGILAQLSTIYGRHLQLISGHRAPGARGTSETSQHTLGRAADIRIPGVTIGELKKVAIKLGARGVGLYPEKGFVHVDVRDKQRYYWLWTARGGEQADMGWPVPPKKHAANSPEPAAEEAGEGSEAGADETHEHEEPAVEQPPEAVAQ